jgi:hypothetical protein
VHVFYVIPYTRVSVGGSYTIPVNISRGMVGYNPMTIIIELRWFTGSHKASMRLVQFRYLLQVWSSINTTEGYHHGASNISDEIVHMFAGSDVNVSMASTFHDDGKTRLYCGSEDNFELRTTQIYEGEDDKDMPFMDTIISSWSDTKRSFNYGKLILMFFHQLF